MEKKKLIEEIKKQIVAAAYDERSKHPVTLENIDINETVDHLGMDSIEVLDLSLNISREYDLSTCKFKLKREDTVLTIVDKIINKLNSKKK